MQINIDRLINSVYKESVLRFIATMVLDNSGAVFFTFRVVKKRQIFGLATAGRNGLSVLKAI